MNEVHSDVVIFSCKFGVWYFKNPIDVGGAQMKERDICWLSVWMRDVNASLLEEKHGASPSIHLSIHLLIAAPHIICAMVCKKVWVNQPPQHAGPNPIVRGEYNLAT